MNSHDANQIIHHLDRIATALERTAETGEAQLAADPLAMLDAALADHGMPGEPEEPFASNGQTAIYLHPTDPAYQIVARRDGSVDGGFTVRVERA